MAALLLDDTTTTAATPDQRRITENDPAMARLKARTVRQLQASIQQLVADLKNGVQPVQAQSHFIDRHLSILRAAYLAAHTEGQRDFYDATSNTPGKWATHEADTATMQRRMSFYAPSVAKMAHEAVRVVGMSTHAPAQLDETDDGDDAVELSNPYPRGPHGHWGEGGPGHGGGSHGESQHAGAGHVSERVGAERGAGSIHSPHFGRAGGGGASGRDEHSTIAGHAQMTKERTQARRAEFAKQGLNARGGKYSYNGYVRAVSRAETSGDHEMAAKLKKLYPEHEAYRKAGGKPDAHQTPEARAARARQHFQQQRQYRREDILSGDHTFKSDSSYRQLMAHALKTGDHAMVRAMVRNYAEHWNRLQARMPQLTKPVRAAFRDTASQQQQQGA